MNEPKPAECAAVSDDALAAIGFDVGSPGLETITEPEPRLRILRAFRDEHRTTMDEVRASVANGDDRTRARALLHKLLGSTATLGLPGLRAAVIDLHTSIREHSDAVPPAHVEAFNAELARVIIELDALG